MNSHYSQQAFVYCVQQNVLGFECCIFVKKIFLCLFTCSINKECQQELNRFGILLKHDDLCVAFCRCTVCKFFIPRVLFMVHNNLVGLIL